MVFEGKKLKLNNWLKKRENNFCPQQGFELGNLEISGLQQKERNRRGVRNS